MQKITKYCASHEKRTQGLKSFEVPRSLRSKPQSLVLKVTQSGIHVYTCQDYVCVKTTSHLPRFLKCALSRALVTQNKGSDPSKDGTFVARSRKIHGPQPSSPVEKNTCSKNFLVWTCWGNCTSYLSPRFYLKQLLKIPRLALSQEAPLHW